MKRFANTIACGVATLGLAAPACADTSLLTRHVAGSTPAGAVSPFVAMAQAARMGAAKMPKAPGTLDFPLGLGLDANGNLYVANALSGVTMYDANFKFTGAIATGTQPLSVAVNFEGTIFVGGNSLAGESALSEYNAAGQLLGVVNDPSLAVVPQMFIDAQNTVWVLDSAGVIHTYLSDTEGNLTALPPLPGGGTSIGPWGPFTTVAGVGSGAGGFAENLMDTALALHNGLSFSLQFQSGELPESGAQAGDLQGNEYVTDLVHDTVVIFNTNGTGASGKGLLQLPAEPSGVAVDPVRNRLYVAFPNQNEIVVYSTIPPYKKRAVIR